MKSKFFKHLTTLLIIFAFLLVPILITPKVKAASSLAVTPAGYDDMGAVLERLGYSADLIQENDLTDYDKIKKYDAIYINCTAGTDSVAKAAADSIRKYVEEGGIVYASDFANSIVDTAFPNKINFYTSGMPDEYSGYDILSNMSRVGNTGTQTATVVDPGLASILGKTSVEINFDAASWAVIDSVNKGVRVYLRGPASIFNYSGDFQESVLENRPYIVSFSYGAGELLYTSFHNEAQNTEDMEKILDWFGTKISAGKLATTTRSLVEEGDTISLQEIIDNLDNAETKTYTFKATGESDFSVTINFSVGIVTLVIKDPDGNVLDTKEVSSPPYTFKIAGAKEGTYTYEVTGAKIDSDNTPIIVLTSGNESAAVDKLDIGTTVVGDDSDLEEKVESVLWKVLIYGAITIVVIIIVIVGGIILLVKLLKKPSTPAPAKTSPAKETKAKK